MQGEKINPIDGAGASVAKGAATSEKGGLHGHYDMVCIGADGQVKWTESFDNLVVTAGKNDLLDKYLSGSAYTAAWYMGLVDNTSWTGYNAADTLASHSGWLEIATGTGYTAAGSSTNRATMTWGGASGGSKVSGTIVFNITSSITVRGALLTTTQARGTSSNGGAGILLSAGDFQGSVTRAVVNGDTLNVTYTLSV